MAALDAKSPDHIQACPPHTPRRCMKLFAGNSNRALAEAVARYLNIPIGKASVRRCGSGNLRRDQENVRGEDVFVLQSTVPDERPPDGTPDHDRCVHALGAAHHCGDSYFGYARQTAALPAAHRSRQAGANMIARAGANGYSPSIFTPGRSRVSSISRPTTSSRCRSCRATSRQNTSSSATSWSYRQTSAAWCAPARSPSASTPSSPSSTSAASGPVSRK